MYKKSISWVMLSVLGLGLTGMGCSGEDAGGVEPEEVDSTAQEVRGKIFTSRASEAAAAAAAVTDAERWKKLTVGGDFSCGIAWDDSIWCWGLNSNGQLGNGTKIDSNKPVKVLGSVTSWKDLKAGWSHMCAVDQTDSLYCWGSGGSGQLGQNNYLDSTTPLAVSSLSNNVSSMSAGGGNTCAILKGTGRLLCWGINTHAQVSADPYLKHPVPYEMDTNTWTRVAVGNGHICGEQSNKIYCSGHSFYGQLGIGATTAWDTGTLTQTQVNGNISDVSAFHYTTCAIRSKGAYCWGFNNYGQVGNGTKTNAMVPTEVTFPSKKDVLLLSAGNAHSCALLADASLYCWGDNNYGQLGTTTPATSSTTPVEVTFAASDPRVSTIHAGGLHTCALLGDQTVRCWGLNGRGQLGNGTTTNSTTPVAVVARGS